MTKRYRVLWPAIGPLFFPGNRALPITYQGDEFNWPHPDDMDRLLNEGMIEAIPEPESAGG